MLQEFSGRVEEIKGNQAVREATDHAVTIRSDGGQVLVLVEDRDGFDGIHAVRLAFQEETPEDRRHVLADPAAGLGIGETRLGRVHRLQATRILARADIELAQHPDRFQLDRVAPPAEAEILEILDRFIAADLTHGQLKPVEIEQGLGLHPTVPGVSQRLQTDNGRFGITFRFREARLDVISFHPGLMIRLTALQQVEVILGGRKIAELQRSPSMGGMETRLPDRRIVIDRRSARGETAAGILPALLADRCHGAPQIRGGVHRQRRMRKIFLGLIEPVQHVAGHTLHGANMGIIGQGRFGLQRQVDHAKRFRGQLIGQEEACQRDLAVRAIFQRGAAQTGTPFFREIAITGPGVEIHQGG